MCRVSPFVRRDIFGHLSGIVSMGAARLLQAGRETEKLFWRRWQAASDCRLPLRVSSNTDLAFVINPHLKFLTWALRLCCVRHSSAGELLRTALCNCHACSRTDMHTEEQSLAFSDMCSSDISRFKTFLPLATIARSERRQL